MMSFFYIGIEWKFQMVIDTSNRDDFMSNTLEEASQLIENLSASNWIIAMIMVGNQEGLQVVRFDELNAKMNFILKVQQKNVNLSEDQTYQECVVDKGVEGS